MSPSIGIGYVNLTGLFVSRPWSSRDRPQAGKAPHTAVQQVANKGEQQQHSSLLVELTNAQYLFQRSDLCQWCCRQLCTLLLMLLLMIRCASCGSSIVVQQLNFVHMLDRLFRLEFLCISRALKSELKLQCFKWQLPDSLSVSGYWAVLSSH